MQPFAITGLIWEEDPNASKRFEIKYIKNINMKDIIKVAKNLSFCFRVFEMLADKTNRLAINNGRKIKL